MQGPPTLFSSKDLCFRKKPSAGTARVSQLLTAASSVAPQLGRQAANSLCYRTMLNFYQLPCCHASHTVFGLIICSPHVESSAVSTFVLYPTCFLLGEMCPGTSLLLLQQHLGSIPFCAPAGRCWDREPVSSPCFILLLCSPFCSWRFEFGSFPMPAVPSSPCSNSSGKDGTKTVANFLGLF